MSQKVTGKDLKELRQPDEFQLVGGRALQWILAHQQKIAMAAAGIVLVALAAWGAAVYKSHRETKAGESLAEALRIEARPIAGQGLVQPGDETFPNRAERNKAAIAAFEKVRGEHGGSLAAQTATLQLALLKHQSGDGAGAIPLFEQFLKDAGNSHPMRPTALEGLGYAQEAAGKLPEARETFARLKDAGAESRGAYQLARLALVEGKPDAKAQLEAVARDHAKDPVAMEANMRLEVASLPPAPASQPAKLEETPAEAPKKAPKAPRAPKAPVKKKGK